MSQLSLSGPVNGRFSLTGPLCLQQIEQFWQQRQPLLSQNCQLDLSGLDNLDSAGLAALVALQAEAKTRHTQLLYTDLPIKVEQLVRVNQLESLFSSN